MFCFFQSNQHFALSLPSKHLLVFKTSWSSLQDIVLKMSWRLALKMFWRHALKTSWRHFLKTSCTRLHCNNFLFSKTSSRRLQDDLKLHFEDVLENEKSLPCKRYEDILKTCLEDIFKTSLRQTKFLLVISVSNHDLLTNLNQYLYLTNLYFMSLRRIQNSLIRTQ